MKTKTRENGKCHSSCVGEAGAESGYSESLEYLSSLETYGIKLGLDQVSELLGYCGNPHEKLKFVHIAGTNGKGSVCAMLYAALRHCGFNTGFYSSPHLVSVRERFRFNGRGITREELTSLVSKLKPAADMMKSAGRCPTYFEFTTVLALLFFLDSNADFVVLETGMGGRYDATNIVDPVCSVITSIGIDHASFLGDTEEKIAFEKAGIIKDGRPVFCGELNLGAEKVIRECANEKNARLFFPGDFFGPSEKLQCRDSIVDANPFSEIEIAGKYFKIPLAGHKQIGNFLLAASVLSMLSEKYGFNYADALSGIGKTSWPARFQILPDGTLVDGGHNPQAIGALVSSVKKYFPGTDFTIIYSALADKDVSAILPMLDEIAREFIFVPIKTSRKSYSENELKKIAVKVSSKRLRTAKTVAEALGLRGGTKTLVTGSLYLAGEVLREYFSEDDIVDI